MASSGDHGYAASPDDVADVWKHLWAEQLDSEGFHGWVNSVEDAWELISVFKRATASAFCKDKADKHG